MDFMTNPDPGSGRATMAGAGRSTTNSTLPQVNLRQLVEASLRVEPACRAILEKAAPTTATGPSDYETELHSDYDRLLIAMATFRECRGLNQEAARNSIQDTVLATADRYCGTYKRLLSLAESNTGMLTGGLSTLLGGLSAIFTNVTTARALGGSAGIVGGLGAEFDAAYFKQVASHVIISGINVATGEIHGEIAGRRSAKIGQYTLESALKDAIRYSDACSVAAGLDKVRDQINLAGHPGIDTMISITNQVDRLSLTRQLTTLAISEPENATKIAAITKRIDQLDKELQTSPPDSLTEAMLRRTEASQRLDFATKAVDAAETKVNDLKAKIAAPPPEQDLEGLNAALKVAEADLAANQETLKRRQLDYDAAQKWYKALEDANSPADLTQDKPAKPEPAKPEPATTKPDLVLTIPFSGQKPDQNALNNADAVIENLKPKRVVIIGHTDGKGSTADNLALSEKRADIVLGKLTKLPGGSDVKAIGAGEILIRKDDPTAGANKVDPSYRRVDIDLYR